MSFSPKIDATGLPASDLYSWNSNVGMLRMSKVQFAAARKLLGLTVEECAVIVNYTTDAVSDWENPDIFIGERIPAVLVPFAVNLMAYMLNRFRPPDWPERLREIS